MSTLLGLGSILGSVGSVFGNVLNYQSQKKANKINQQANYLNQLNWQREFDYTKYLNQNQHQIESQDLIKSGINPVSGVSNGVNTFNASANTQSSNEQAPYIDFNSLAQIGLGYDQMKQQAELTRESNENAKDIAEINAEASKYSADTSAGASKYSADTSAGVSKYVAELNSSTSKEISKLNSSTSKEIANLNNKAQERLQKLQQSWEDSDSHQQILKNMEQFKSDLEDLLKNNDFLRNTRVVYNGEIRDLREIEIQFKNFESMCRSREVNFSTDETQRAFENFMSGFGTVLGFFGRAVGGSRR